jgi:hypothetical protein
MFEWPEVELRRPVSRLPLLQRFAIGLIRELRCDAGGFGRLLRSQRLPRIFYGDDRDVGDEACEACVCDVEVTPAES